MKEIILEIMVGAFKRKLIVSDMVEMNKIAGGIDEATKAHYFEFAGWFADNCVRLNDDYWLVDDKMITIKQCYNYWLTKDKLKDK